MGILLCPGGIGASYAARNRTIAIWGIGREPRQIFLSPCRTPSLPVRIGLCPWNDDAEVLSIISGPPRLSSRRKPGSTRPWIPAFAGMTRRRGGSGQLPDQDRFRSALPGRVAATIYYRNCSYGQHCREREGFLDAVQQNSLPVEKNSLLVAKEFPVPIPGMLRMSEGFEALFGYVAVRNPKFSLFSGNLPDAQRARACAFHSSQARPICARFVTVDAFASSALRKVTRPCPSRSASVASLALTSV